MSDFMLDNYAQIIGYADKLKMLRALLSHPWIDWVMRFFSRTRNWNTALYFVDYCRSIMKQNAEQISSDEYNEYDKLLIYCELDAYDHLNLWNDYIYLFNTALNEKSYTLMYTLHRDDPVFNSYLLYQDKNYKYVHFMYACDRRYQIISRKNKRLYEDRSVEHLRRHQQERLADDELNARYEEMVYLFEYIKSQSVG